MPNKLSGTAIQSGTITSTQLSATLTTTIESGGGPKIASIIYPGDDLAANTNGGQTLYITGSGFKSNSTVYINGNNVPSVSYISASNLSFTGPALSSASYPVYVINPEDGATAILIPGLQVSGEPSWVTGATLTEQDATGTWNISLSATGDAPLTYALAAGSSLPTGISLASNGVISGTITTPPESDTTYNFTVVASDAQNQDSSRAFSVTATTGEGALFANNVLLIHADGTNNQNNHTFLDSSNNNFTITRNGNASQGTFSPFSQTGWSAYFDGTSDTITYTGGSSLNFGTSDFTIELWVNMANTNTFSPFLRPDDEGAFPEFGYDWSTSELKFQARNGAIATVSTTAVVRDVWNHIAVSRSGTSLRLFVNGTQVGSTVTNSTNFGSTTGTIRIGGSSFSGSHNINGYLSNFRVVKGTALYTEAFTPSTTPLQPVTNTSILTCQSNRFVDEGPNNYTLTRNGDISVQPFGPFAPVITTANSNSVYFDGTGDYLSVPSSNAFDVGSDNFTMEAWIYPTSYGADYGIIIARYTSGGASNQPFFLSLETNGTVRAALNGTYTLQTTATAPLNTWTHVALTRSSNDFTIWLNGVSSATLNQSVTINNPSIATTIGAFGLLSSNYLTGHISNLRVVKGTAVYTSAFTPSTSPLTAISNTSLLTCQSTTFIDNSTNALTITPSGNVLPRSFNPFGYVNTASAYSTANVGGSGYFDGSGDYINTPSSGQFAPTGDFTIAWWYYPTTLQTSVMIANYTGNNLTDWSFETDSTGDFNVYLNGSTQRITASGVIKKDAWNYLVVSRSGSTVTAYCNGASIGTYTLSGTFGSASKSIRIGAGSAGTNNMVGYCAGVILIDGTALDGTIPTTPPTNVANTALLLNFTNAGIFDQTAKNVIETVGDAKVSTTQYKYGSASMYFDGTGDWLRTPTSPNLNMGTGDLTIEGWFYLTATVAVDYRMIVSDATNGNNYAAIRSGGTGGQLEVNVNGTSFRLNLNNSVVINTWFHLAVTRYNGTWYGFVNGASLGSNASAAAFNLGNGGMFVGRFGGATAYEWPGYIDDLRITKGYARYTSNFTAPTSALKDK